MEHQLTHICMCVWVCARSARTTNEQLQIIYGILISSYDSEDRKCQNFMEFWEGHSVPVVYDVGTVNSRVQLLAAF
jgi:hypothetical protein